MYNLLLAVTSNFTWDYKVYYEHFTKRWIVSGNNFRYARWIKDLMVQTILFSAGY